MDPDTAPPTSEMASSSSSSATPHKDISAKKLVKEKVPGIIYLSSIPDGMQYNDIYRVFSELGQVGRISLNGAASASQSSKTRKRRVFKEGWVEFLDKKRAKRCVLLLNNQLVGGKRKSKWYECIWHMKYLPKFQWSHLSERLAYEHATTQQRLRTEVAQARREAQHFAEQLDWKQREAQLAKKHGDWKSHKKNFVFSQSLTDDEIRKRKVGTKRVQELEKSRNSVINSLFSKPKT